MAYPVKFAPIAQQRIWGGSRLKEWFGETCEEPVGEYWVLSGHPSAPSVVSNGEMAGKTLKELIEAFPEAYVGHSPYDRFPLLIKFLEASDDLSVQIHPDDEYAGNRHGEFGKTEAWYFLEAKEGAKVVYGHSFQNKEEYAAAVRVKRVRDYLQEREIQKGQLVFVPAGTLHALLAGTILIEIQQTSDITYRVYDWDRVDATGAGRELHIEQAADVMRYGENELPDGTDLTPSEWVRSEGIFHEHLLTCPYFVIEKVTLRATGYQMELGRAGNPDILVVASGEGVLDSEPGEPLALRRGDAVLIPSTMEKYGIRTDSEMEVLKIYY
jgi:mannose-6-phosphate isomerase